jgi:iron complex transport system substrate-binding protein
VLSTAQILRRGGNVRFSTVSVALFAALATAFLILALFSPRVRESSSVSAHTSIAPKPAIFATVLSGYATINQGADRVLAVSAPAREWATDGLLNHVYPALERIPVACKTANPDPEQVLRLRPDAVFVYTMQADVLKKTGLPVVEIMNDPKNPIGSREKVWRQMGQIAGKSSRMTALLNGYAAKREALKRQLDLDVTRKVRVAYLHVNNGDWYTTNSNYYIAYKLELAGARNVFKDFRFTAKGDLEQLLLADPDIILFAVNPNDRTIMGQVGGWPEFQSLRAIRQGRVYRLPLHTYMNELVEDRMLLTWMAEVFYPDAMPRRLRDEYKETYREVYHYAISDDEIDKAIYLEENRLSAGYDRFAR